MIRVSFMSIPAKINSSKDKKQHINISTCNVDDIKEIALLNKIGQQKHEIIQVCDSVSPQCEYI